MLHQKRLAILSLGGLLAAYVVCSTILGRFAVTDEVMFKAAGRHWAVTGHFAAPELKGCVPADPPVETVYALYPPVYPFLYGFFTWIVGFGWREAVFYDVFIHAALVAATIAYGYQYDKRFLGVLGTALAIALLPQGNQGRPDDLGMLFAMLGLCCLAHDTRPFLGAFLAGGAFGMSCGTSLGTGVLIGLCAPPILLTQDRPLRSRIAVCLVLAITGITAVALIWLPLLLYYPLAWKQLSAHIARLHGEEAAGYGSLLSFAWRYGSHRIILALSCLAIAALAFVLQRRLFSTRLWYVLWGGPIMGIAYLLWFLPGKYTYLWFIMPLLIVACFITIVRMWSETPRLSVLSSGLLLAGTVIASLPFVKDTLIMLTLPSGQSYAANARSMMEVIGDGKTVLADNDAWWLLGDRCQVYCREFSRPDLDQVEFIVRSGNGSGSPGTPFAIDTESREYVSKHFMTICDDLARQPLTLGGVRITRSAYGFGQYILKRRFPTPHAAASPEGPLESKASYERVVY